MGFDVEHAPCQTVDHDWGAVPEQLLNEIGLESVVLIEPLARVGPKRGPGEVDQVRFAIQFPLDSDQGVLEPAGCREVVVTEPPGTVCRASVAKTASVAARCRLTEATNVSMTA
jgi:hypothetical protein